jgi:hypothetical protein
MKTQFKNLANNLVLFFLALMTMFICGCGCNTSKPIPNPLASFHPASQNPNQIIEKDYQDYIQTLSPEERQSPSVHFFEDGTGQHAVDIIIGMNGRWWRHILIYDKADKRIKTIKYKTGYYAS